VCDSLWNFEFPTAKRSVKGQGNLVSRGICVPVCKNFKRLLVRLNAVETEDRPCPYGANCNRGKPYNKDYLLTHLITNHLINLEQE
jgi:hypothetical protein